MRDRAKRTSLRLGRNALRAMTGADWLSCLARARNDLRQVRAVAEGIQKSCRPGVVHDAATNCRRACVEALRKPMDARPAGAAQHAIRSLEEALGHRPRVVAREVL